MKHHPKRRRTRAREVALQFLYQHDLCGQETLADMTEFLDRECPDKEVESFAARLVHGTLRQLEGADRQLREVTRNWDLDRMAVVDRNVLRMAIFELLHCPDIPPKVTINEAIELGKKFSTANSGAFINGILDRVRMNQEALGAEGGKLGEPPATLSQET